MRSARIRTVLFVLLFLAGACANASAPQNDVTPLVVHLFKVSQTAGGIVAVKRGPHVYIETYGLRDVATRAPVDADTRFEIGSVTKQFTAAAVLQLKERGKLRLDDPLSAYLPAFPHAAEVTLRELLNQTSGLADYAAMPDFPGQSRTAGNANKIAGYASRPLVFPPGSRWEYSNTNYYVLGQVIEAASHQSYERYIRSHIFRPAGMRRSGFVDEEREFKDFATPYFEGRPASPTLQSWAGGAGAIVSTVGDLLKWNASLAAGRIISKQDYTLMCTPVRLASAKLDDYGMGLSIDTQDGHRRIWHNGATNGSVALDSVFPADRTDIVVLENTSGGIDPGIIERVILDELFPDALAAARRPAAGETAALRNRLVPMMRSIFDGTLNPDDASPAFRRFWESRRKAMAAYWAPFGPPQREIFKGSSREKDGVWYDYRIEFAQDVRECEIEIDNSNRLSNLSIAPPS